MYYTGALLSLLIGLWHFSVPYLFQWHSYIGDGYEALRVGIDWINFFFSLFLAGLSLLMLVYGKKIVGGNGDLLPFYGFLVFVWLARFVITFVRPWPLAPVSWVAYGQQLGAFLIFSLLLVPFLKLVGWHKVRGGE